jgi:hypothetical protein
MMTTPVERAYFGWLCDQVNIEYGKPTDKTYFQLLEVLHSKEFVWIVANDDNRIVDGMDVRYLFYNEIYSGRPKKRFIDKPVSVLEVIIGLSNRLGFLDGGGPGDWAWRLIENRDLHKMWDPLSSRKRMIIEDRLDVLIWRRYEPDGTGGFFPLAYPDRNQLKEEIWHQMNSYLAEQLQRS